MFKIRLKELRERKGMTQRDFAKDFGVSKGTVGMWESGAREPRTLDEINRIADYFHVTTDYLLGRSPGEVSKGPSPQFIRRTELLARRGISRSALSKESGISTYRLKHYFSEDTISKTGLLDEYSKLARALGVSPQYLYCLTDHENDEADTDERFRDWVMENYEYSPNFHSAFAEKESTALEDGGGLSDEDIRLIEWFRSLPPEKRKAILMLGEAPEGLDELAGL